MTSEKNRKGKIEKAEEPAGKKKRNAGKKRQLLEAADGKAKMELGILGGRVYLNGNFAPLNVYVKDGKIEALTSNVFPCEETVDAQGLMVLPGFIDPHVHFHLGVGNNVNAEDFRTGSIKGALGGITTYIDFLDPVKRASDVAQAFEARSGLADTSFTDYAFHATIANPTDAPEDMITAFKSCGITSVKLFTTYADTDRRTKDRYIYQLLKASGETGIQVVVHAENDDLIDHGKKIPVSEHESSRPAISERTEALVLAEMAEETDGNLYLVHMSAGSTVETLKARHIGALAEKRIRLESCPHYFVFNRDVYSKPDGYLYTMTPPLRSERDRILLCTHFDAIDTIGTDHCPYRKEEKNHTYTSEIPMGIGGISYSFQLLFTRFGSHAIDRFTKNPAQAYGLYPQKGALKVGADADIVLFDDLAPFVVSDENSVYNGMTLKGRIESVFKSGHILVKDGVFQASDCIPKGRYLRRT